MSDARADNKALLGRLEIRSGRSIVKFVACLVIAAVLAAVPTHAGLAPAGRWALFILVLSAGLWISEALPTFAVGVLAMALEVAILGRPGGAFAKGAEDWTIFIRVWSSPLILLFLGGFVLAAAAAKTGLDRWLSARALSGFGSRPPLVLLGCMTITFVFSMFISNTATTAMMMPIIAPIVASLASQDRFGKALLLGVPFAANLGGMATLIGSPPNAIAAGMLAHDDHIDFLTWMHVGLPPALLMAAVVWIFLLWRYGGAAARVDLGKLTGAAEPHPPAAHWQRLVTMVVFVATVLLWMTGPLHGIPTPVVSFLPIAVFTMTGVLQAEDVRHLPWDVLLLLAGGLSLGVAVSETGLARWIVGLLPGGVSPLWVALGLAYVCSALSNVMSNTAAANILAPIALALGRGQSLHYVVPVALAASSAMCLPVSTPPNAIAFSEGRLHTRDFLAGGLIVGVLTPAVAIPWCEHVFGWVLSA